MLSQDGAWFDMNNFNEIPAKLNNEVLLIQKALGEKFGTIVFCFAILISGLAVGFIKGWNLALAIMAFAPLIAIGTHLTTEMFASGKYLPYISKHYIYSKLYHLYYNLYYNLFYNLYYDLYYDLY